MFFSFRAGGRGRGSAKGGVQGQVKFQNIDPWLTQYPQVPPVGILSNEGLDLLRGNCRSFAALGFAGIDYPRYL